MYAKVCEHLFKLTTPACHIEFLADLAAYQYVERESRHCLISFAL